MTADFHALVRPARPPLSGEGLFAALLDEATFAGRVEAAPSSPSGPNAPLGGVHDALGNVGFGHVRGVLDPTALAGVRGGIDAARRLGLPPVFAFLYADVWRGLLTPALRKLAETLCPGAQLLPRGYVTIVPLLSTRGGGWPPHLDAVDVGPPLPDGRDARMTLWIAVTPATVHNGCMYLVPETETGIAPERWFREPDVSGDDAARFLHAARAMPCAAGDALFWRPHVVHYSQPATAQAAASRIAVALHLVHRDAPVQARERPLLPLDAGPPDHAARLHFVARQVLAYAAYNEEAERLAPYVPLARRLLTT